METVEKLRVLGGAAKYDICSATGCGSGNFNGFAGAARNVVCHSFTPDGRCISLFRVLMTNECQKDCFYCPNRAQRDVPRTSFEPEELARLFIEFYRRNYVEGLFLSSGISYKPASTMYDMIKTVEILRLKYRYTGYVHLKILPGAGYDYVERCADLASRVSINMEAPNQERLSLLSRTKSLQNDVLARMDWIKKFVQKKKLPAGQTTQFIVGAAGETDLELLTSVKALYDDYGLRSAYFSAFQPVEDTPLAHVSATPLVREHRLYQAEILMRQYGITFNELVFGKSGNLSLKMDPKILMALNNIGTYPLEINKANYGQLLRVPGIGHTAAGRIIRARKNIRISEAAQLRRMGVVIKRALPFLMLNGKSYDMFKYVEQLALWSDENADTPELDPPFLHQGSFAISGRTGGNFL